MIYSNIYRLKGYKYTGMLRYNEQKNTTIMIYSQTFYFH